MARYNFLTTGYTITDEVINRSSATAYRIGHDLIKATGFVVRTGAGGTGTLLTLTTDYVLSVESTDHSTAVGSTIYTKLAIVNGAYHNTDLYVTYTTVGDLGSVENTKEIADNVIYPLTAAISANTTYTVAEGASCYTVIIPKAYLIAASGGPYTLTITTGVAATETVKIPISITGITPVRGLQFNVFVDSSGNVMSDAIITSPLEYTMIITGTTTNPTKGTVSRDAAFWSMNKNRILVDYDLVQTGAGSAGSGSYLYKIPFPIDTTRNAVGSVVGIAFLSNQTDEITAVTAVGDVIVASSTTVSLKFTIPTEGTARLLFHSSTLVGLDNATARVRFTMSAYCSDWI